jgi:hypothetical protein
MLIDQPPGGIKREGLLSPPEEILTGSLQNHGSDPEVFSEDFISEAQKENTPEKEQDVFGRILKMGVPEKLRLAGLGNQTVRKILIHDANKIISLAVLKNPRVTENEVLSYAHQKNLHEEVLVSIAKNKNWVKKYPIRLALVCNPKIPLPVAVKFIDYLHDRDLQMLSRNKNISSVVCGAAARLLSKRRI